LKVGQVLKLVACALVASATAAAQPASKGVNKVWPPASEWVTFLKAAPGGRPVCAILHKGDQSAAVPGAFMITLTEVVTRFNVSYLGGALPVGPSLSLSVDGVKVVDAPILSQYTVDGWTSIMADLPGRTFADVLVPAFTRANRIQADAGGRRFTTTTGQFARVMPQLVECAQAVLAMQSGKKLPPS